MGGLAKTHYRPMKKWIKRVLIVGLLIAGTLPLIPVSAQPPLPDPIAFMRADYRPDSGDLTIQVGLTTQATITGGSLAIDERAVELRASPVEEALEQWFVLDAGSDMVNAQSSVNAAILRLLNGVPAETRTGFIFFDAEVATYQPTTQRSQVQAILSDYQATVDAPSCLYDALAELAEQDAPLDHPMRVLLVAGPVSRQGICHQHDLPPLDFPVDVLVIADAIAPEHQAIADQTHGQLQRANLLTINTAINTISMAWQQPVFTLHGAAGTLGTPTGTLTIQLADERELTVPLTLQFDAENAMAQVATPTSDGGLQVVATDPPTATSTSIPSATATPTLTLTPIPTDPPTPTAIPTSSPAAFTAAPVTDAPPTTSAPVTATTAAIEPTANQNAASALPDRDTATLSPTPAGTAIAAAPVTNPDVDPPAPASSPAPVAGTKPNLALYGGIGLLVLSTLLAAIYLLRPNSSSSRATTAANNERLTETELIYRSGGLATPAPTARSAPPQPSATGWIHDEHDELLITQVIEDAAFQARQSASAKRIIGWLRLNTVPVVDYEIGPEGALIGSEPGCDIAIRTDPAIKAQHARLDVRPPDSIWLSVLPTGSQPVIVSGQVVLPGNSCQLRPQSVIKLTPRTQLVFIQRGSEDLFDDDVTLL